VNRLLARPIRLLQPARLRPLAGVDTPDLQITALE
jgi:hypothetical protein